MCVCVHAPTHTHTQRLAQWTYSSRGASDKSKESRSWLRDTVSILQQDLTWCHCNHHNIFPSQALCLRQILGRVRGAWLLYLALLWRWEFWAISQLNWVQILGIIMRSSSPTCLRSREKTKTTKSVHKSIQYFRSYSKMKTARQLKRKLEFKGCTVHRKEDKNSVVSSLHSKDTLHWSTFQLLTFTSITMSIKRWIQVPLGREEKNYWGAMLK